jgi:hypothetical protein
MKQLKIPYDINATNAYELITSLLNDLNVTYEESSEEVITIDYTTPKPLVEVTYLTEFGSSKSTMNINEVTNFSKKFDIMNIKFV